MNPLPFRYEDWLQKTSGGTFALRTSQLKALDEAIKVYDRTASVDMATEAQLLAVRNALLAFIADEEARRGVESWKRGPRNRDRIIETLANAVGLGITADHNDVQAFRYDEAMVPEVPDPVLDPIPLPPPPQIDPKLEARAKALSRPAARKGLSHAAPVRELTPPPPTPPPPPHGPAPRPAKRPSVSPGIAPTELTPPPVVTPASPAPDIHAIVREVDQLTFDVTRLKTQVDVELLHRVNLFKTCVDAGFKEFVALHKADAEAVNFKLSLAKSFFEAMSAAPFPFSVVGSVGAGVVGLFKADTDWDVVRTELPTPAGFMGFAEKAGEEFKRRTTVNVPPSSLKSQEQVVQDFLGHVDSFRGALDKNFDKHIESLSDRQKRLVLAERLAASPAVSAAGATADTKRFLGELEAAIRKQFTPFLQRPAPNVKAVSDWITVQMIADFALSGLAKDRDVRSGWKMADLGGLGLGDSLARFLGSANVDVVQLKSEKGDSAKIYANGRIPWNGTANQKVAIFLYLDWYRRNVNPYMMLMGTLNPAQIQYRSRLYLERLGSAMMLHKSSPFTWTTGVSHRASQPAPSAPTHSIGDAFSHGI